MKANWSSQNDRSRLESADELKEIDTTEKKKDYSVTGDQIFHPGEDNIEERNCQRRENAKERKVNWWREIGMKKTRLLNSGSLKLQRPKVLVLLQYFIILSLLIFN